MVDKTKQSPIPERPKIGAPDVEKRITPDQQSGNPTFIRGTIDPPIRKKEQ
jgi:hypothetical protein